MIILHAASAAGVKRCKVLTYPTIQQVLRFCIDVLFLRLKMKETELPKFDLPTNFVVTDDIPVSLLQRYGLFPCKIKACLFVLCTAGSVEATVNLSRRTIHAGDFVTLLPDSFIQVRQVSDDMKLCVAGFSSEFMSRSNYLKTVVDHFYSIMQYPALSLPQRLVDMSVDSYKLLVRSYALGGLEHNLEILSSILNIFLQTCKGFYKHYIPKAEQAANRDREICRKFILLLTQHCPQEHNVNFYAKCCRITPQHFSTVVKRVTGKTPLEMINGLLIINAKERLYTTNKPIKEIAFAMGFSNPSHFNRFFKEHTGTTPQQYRMGLR